MTGWYLFKHAVSMLVRNWQMVIQIFLLPTVLVGVILGVLAQQTEVLALLSPGAASEFTPGGGLVGSVLLTAIVVMLISMWPIVAWHRYVLEEEQNPGFLPPLHLDRILAYAFQGILIGLLVLLAMIPVLIVIAVLASVLGGNFVHVLPILEPGLALLPAWVFLRLSITLPDVALGKTRLSITDAWKATSDAFGPVFGLVLITVVMQFAIEQSLLLLTGPVVVVWWALTSVVFGLIQVSILTTLYGHYVEKRPI